VVGTLFGGRLIYMVMYPVHQFLQTPGFSLAAVTLSLQMVTLFRLRFTWRFSSHDWCLKIAASDDSMSATILIHSDDTGCNAGCQLVRMGARRNGNFGVYWNQSVWGHRCWRYLVNG